MALAGVERGFERKKTKLGSSRVLHRRQQIRRQRTMRSPRGQMAHRGFADRNRSGDAWILRYVAATDRVVPRCHRQHSAPASNKALWQEWLAHAIRPLAQPIDATLASQPGTTARPIQPKLTNTLFGCDSSFAFWRENIQINHDHIISRYALGLLFFSTTGPPLSFHAPKPPSICATFSIPMSCANFVASAERQPAAQ